MHTLQGELSDVRRLQICFSKIDLTFTNLIEDRYVNRISLYYFYSDW